MSPEPSVMMVEEWRPAPSLDGYEVSSHGRVRSWRNRRGFPRAEPVIVGHADSRGYRVIRPVRRGPGIRVHRLVCEAFNGPAPFEGAIVRHLDDIPANNCASNLAWGTYADNAADRSRNGHSRSPRNARLTAEQVQEIRRRKAGGEVARTIAADFEITDGTVYHIASGRTWGHL